MVRKNVHITSARIRGRWYGMMIILGDESGRNMSELLGKDKATEVLTMLEISNEFPEEFKVVSRPLKSPFLRDVVLTQYLANFLKHATKSFHGSFEVIDRNRQKNVHSISRHTLIKVAA